MARTQKADNAPSAGAVLFADPAPEPKQKLKHKAALEREEVAAYLEAIARGLSQGDLILGKGEQVMSLQAAERIQLEVKAATKDGASRLRLELSWPID